MFTDIWEVRIKPHLSSIVIYIVILFIVYWCITSERKDQNCADSKGTNCGPGKGRAYYNSHPEPGDSSETLIRKLQATAKYDQLAIHWRLNMLVAVASAFIGLYIVQRKFPSARDLGIFIIVIFLATYAAMIQFQQSVSNPAGKQADVIATQLLYDVTSI